jgi:hypothetical protein
MNLPDISPEVRRIQAEEYRRTAEALERASRIPLAIIDRDLARSVAELYERASRAWGSR